MARDMNAVVLLSSASFDRETDGVEGTARGGYPIGSGCHYRIRCVRPLSDSRQRTALPDRGTDTGDR